MVATWAREGLQGLCLAYADEQTSGRGRAGRRWLTPSGSALAFSLLLAPAQLFEPNLLGLVSGLGALAVCKALETLYQLSPKIKWPNDVLLEGRKVSGVLAESSWAGEQLQALILGIGINVAPNSAPPAKELNFPATCLENVLGKKVNSALLLRSILDSLIAWKDRLSEPTFVQAWEQRLAFKGERVRLGIGEKSIVEGEIHGLSADGQLQIRLPSAEVQTFHMGEIQIRSLVDRPLK
ncbi:MAG: biotin--[acetyl-CoA-carboxylase] ligase [Chloroflexi bacterium]|nr:biotin--[acetyl-CoA-carboxylase] ligase [Chloroflexota bacterium]